MSINQYMRWNTCFTTGLDNSNTPIDNITQIELRSTNIIHYTDWTNVKIRTHVYRCELYDGLSKLVYVNEMSITPTSNSMCTSSKYQMKPTVNSHGIWIVKVFMDNHFMIKDELQVLKSKESPIKVVTQTKQLEALQAQLLEKDQTIQKLLANLSEQTQPVANTTGGEMDKYMAPVNTVEFAREVLNLPKNYSRLELKTRRNELIKQYHTDGVVNDRFRYRLQTNIVSQINNAYDLLNRSLTRK